MYTITSNHFAVAQGSKGNLLTLRNNIFPDFSFIFFSSPTCKQCSIFSPVFFQLAQAFPQCAFANVNVLDNNRMLITMSRDTIMPIRFVPLLVIYYKGIPHMAYNQNPSAPRDFQSIAGFINFTTKQGSSRSSTNGGGECANPSNPNMPQYCSYTPRKDPSQQGLCDLNVAYGVNKGDEKSIHREGFMLVTCNPDDTNCIDGITGSQNV
jgi:thiol-disulfide isomerase/thioredoxin